MAAEQEIVRLAKLLNGFAINQIIASAVRYNIPSHVVAGRGDRKGLVTATGLPWERLRMVMAVLADLGIVDRDADELFRANPTTELLTEESGRLYGHALLSGDMYYKVWEQLDHSLNTGQSAFQAVYGTSMWEYLDAHPTVAEHFSRTMGAGSAMAAEPVLTAYDFPDTGKIVDVGAGDGSLMAAILERHALLDGCIVELPAQARRAGDTLAERGLADRCEVIAGDMRETLPEDGDVYLFKGVFHNWPDDVLMGIMKRLHTRTKAGTRVLVVERALPEDEQITLQKAINTLTMTLLFGTTDRTSRHYESLLAGAGFDARVLPSAASELDLIEAIN